MHRRADRTHVLQRWFHDPCAPDQFAHHALVAGADVRLIPALERDLRLRLYSGGTGPTGAIRSGAFRQGAAGKLAAWLCSTGCIGLIAIGLAASPLGRDSRQLARQGGVVRAALSAPELDKLNRPVLCFCFTAVLAAGLVAAASPRKHVWLVAHPVAAGRIDLWIAGTASRDPESFAREFAGFVRRATHLARGFESAGNGTRRGSRRHRSTRGRRTVSRGTGSVAST
jgi:hypothetical protein